MSEYINYHYNAECQVCFETGLLIYDGLCADCIYNFLVQQPLTNHFHSKVFKSFDLLYYTSINDKITKLVIEQLKNKIKHDVELNFKGYIERKTKEFKDIFGINVVIKYNKTKLDYLLKINDDKFNDLTNEDYDQISRYLNSYKQHRIMFMQHEQLVDCIVEEINFVLMCCPMDELHTIYDVLFKNVKRFAEKKCMYNLTDQIIIYLIYETARNHLLKHDRQMSRENVKKLFKDLCRNVPSDVEIIMDDNSKIVGLCNNCQGKVNGDYICIQCGTKHCNKCFKSISEKHKCEQQDKDDYKYLISTTVMCPTCGLRVTKNGGCKHMFCLRCRTSYDVDSVSKHVTKTKDTHTNPDEHNYYARNDLMLSYQYIKHFSDTLFDDDDSDDFDDSSYEEIAQRVLDTLDLGPHILNIPDICRGIKNDLEFLFGESHLEVFIEFMNLRTNLVLERSETEILKSFDDFKRAFNNAIEYESLYRPRNSEDKSKKRMTKLSKILDKFCKQKRTIKEANNHYHHVNPTKKPIEYISKLIIEQVDKNLFDHVDGLKKKIPSEYVNESKDIINYELEKHIKQYIDYKKTMICYNLTNYVNKLFKLERKIDDEMYKTYFTDYLGLIIKRFKI